MPKQSSRAALTKKNDLDLTPPEEIRARRIWRFAIFGAIVVSALGVMVYFGAAPFGRAIKGWQSRRLAREALALIEQKNWQDAQAKARDALLLRPTEPEAWRAIARLLSRMGQGAAALEWWKKLDDAQRLTIEDRRDFTGAAFAADEFPAAAKQVEALLAQRGGPSPVDIVLAAQLAARQNDPILAVDYAERVLADKRAKAYDILSAATLVFSATKADSQPYASAWKQIEDVARETENPASLDALAFLARAQERQPVASIGVNSSLSLAGTSGAQPTTSTQAFGKLSLELGGARPSDTALAVPTMSATEIADGLEKHPAARPIHRLLALEVRARQDPALTVQYVRDAVEQFGNSDNETVAALAGWLNNIGQAVRTLQVLPEVRALQRQDLFMAYVDALVALQRWNELKDLLSSEHSVIDPVLQHIYLAIVQTHLGSATAAANEWKRALETANTPDKFQALASYAEQNGANDIADAAYSEIIKIDSKNRTAYAGRLRLALAGGHTTQAQSTAAEIARLWPDDAAARNEDNYLRVLLGAPVAEVEAAERDAEVLVAKEPANWSARATLGLARLRLGRNRDALAAFRDVWVAGNEPPGVLAVRAAILAATGYEDGARQEARILGGKPLLPEERALITPLIAVGD